VAFNDAMRILLKRPKWTRASEMFVAAGVNTFKAVLRNLMYEFICRVDDSENEIIMFLSNINSALDANSPSCGDTGTAVYL